MTSKTFCSSNRLPTFNPLANVVAVRRMSPGLSPWRRGRQVDLHLEVRLDGRKLDPDVGDVSDGRHAALDDLGLLGEDGELLAVDPHHHFVVLCRDAAAVGVRDQRADCLEPVGVVRTHLGGRAVYPSATARTSATVSA